MFARFELMRLIRSASFNDEMAAELLHELSRHAPTADLAYRILDVAAHMSHDAKSLGALYQSMASDSLYIAPQSSSVPQGPLKQEAGSSQRGTARSHDVTPHTAWLCGVQPQFTSTNAGESFENL
ncbi:hypothetical protein ACUTAH_27180 [Metapseudomonas furukawaii]|uniref:hypothetical protein n=1 Tax=Metapseudomonas furukawaii TaxID=1149133 RepID=UPI004045AA98